MFKLQYHLDCHDVGIYDRVVIQELIKTIAQTKQFNSTEQRSFKVIVIVEVDKLTRDAQHGLRRTMEKYVSSCRLVLCCNSTSRVIPAIRSRCLAIRVAAPTLDEISGILKKVATLEGIQLPVDLANRIGEKSQRNLRRALLMLQSCVTQKQFIYFPLTKDQQIIEPDWEIYLRDTARMIGEQQTPQRILEARERLYELIAHCIPAEIIFKGLLDELLANCDDLLKSQITQIAAEYEHRLRQGSKEIFHLEAFIAKFILLLVCGIAFALPSRENTLFERMRILGPLAPTNSRVSFTCSALAPSPTVPTSVHALRPADIQHIGAIGDSLTAANGAKASTIIGLLIEYRGVSWSIGGDSDLTKVVTLANIMKKFNTNLNGFSTGTGNHNASNALFNLAKPGAISADMPNQANMLIDRMIGKLGTSRFNSEWKLVTFFIGGNDLCSYCEDTNRYSTAAYKNNIKTTLDILHSRMPRTLVNFVTVLNVAELEDLHEGAVCKNMQVFLCDCAVKPETREIVRVANIAYQRATNELVDSGIYDTRNDFTVVRQPFMEHMQVPATSDGKPDFSYFAPDCFHFSSKGHEAAAVELWNNMMEKVGQKTTLWNLADTLKCPSTGNGYIYTSKNS
ncbi:unnamed protein product [Rotaria sp. Silwood2]|nr:unnamed protein product [Rotaria sp. Silwood2]